jgi:predicted Fe-Mo cluster-binding NifX family protein
MPALGPIQKVISPTFVLAQELHRQRCMKIAIPHWQARVSPVCDEARHFLVVDLTDDQESGRSQFETTLSGADLVGRATQLLDLGVTTVICGAISKGLETMLQGVGIEVIAQVCGNVEDVFQAFRTGTLGQDRFALPGCARRRRRQRTGQCPRDLRY